MGEDLAQLVIGNLADESAARTERGEARQSVRRRSAGNLARGAHGAVKLVRAVSVDQGHPAAHQAEALDQFILAGGHHINDGVADRDDVGSRLGHGKIPLQECENAPRLAAARAQGKGHGHRPRPRGR